VKVLVTGADGFVGRVLVRRLLADGHEVFGAVRPTPARTDLGFTPAEQEAVRWIPLELTDTASVRACVALPYDAVIHLAAVASAADALRDPGAAWDANAGGSARIADVLAEAKRAGTADPLLLLVSSAEVYGRRATARLETDPIEPISPYGASKAGAEIAVLEAWRRAGLRVVIARAFPHTGAGQDPRFVVPAFAERLKCAKRIGARVVKVGNLDPVREFLHVADVVDAYVRLLSLGQAGEAYNVASGRGISLQDLLLAIARLVGVDPIPEVDPALVRPADIPFLVGDGGKLRAATGWAPRHTLDQTLREVLDAAAD